LQRAIRYPKIETIPKREGPIMTATDAAFSGSIPQTYDTHLGPLIFEPYARDLGERVRPLRPARLLETAAGTGIVTRELARALPSSVAIVATDLNQAMIDFAAAKTTAGNIAWRQADAQVLPFGDGEFDVVVCQFGVMLFPDKVGAYREARRVLKPGGRFIFNVWGRIEDNEMALIVHRTVAALFPDDPPGFLARAPYGYHDANVIRRDVAAAGFASIEIETVTKVSQAPAASEPVVGFCQGSPLRAEIEARDAARMAETLDAATKAMANRFGSGPIEGSIQAHVVSAIR
jgi:SAM-dependent methyltransferase